MLNIKKSNERGYNKIDWLESYYSFSFADYYNPNQMGFSYLRVINEDFIQPQTGFGFHPHRDMEIITFMLDGELTHEDNLGNTGKITKGNVQLMRAGSGIFHSEVNLSAEVCHLLQIWIKPNQKNLKPSWQEKQFDSNTEIDLLIQPINPMKQISNLNQKLNSSDLKIYQDAFIIKVQGNQTLDFSKFGQSQIYIQAINHVDIINIDNKKSYELNHGDALYGETQNCLEIKTEGIAIIFVFPN